MNVLKWVLNGRLIIKTICLIALFCMGFLNSSPALAHKVSIFGWVEGDTVHTQSKFMGGKRPEQALVEVFDISGNLLLKGKTDSQGLFSFLAPLKSDMQIVLTTGMGHRADWAITRSDFQKTLTGPNSSQNINIISPGNSHTSKPSPEESLSAAEITALVETTMDRKLQPLMDRIAAINENRISLFNILGGIGCIIGLVGLVTYVQYRRKRSDAER
jgi:nickel transport protein